MGKQKKKPKTPDNTIAVNKKAHFDYFIEDQIEAGISLEGWEVKSLRGKNIQIKESYVQIHQGELYLYGCHITPLPTASTHIKPEPIRKRKLLLHRREIDRLIGSVERKGYTIAPLKMYWLRGRAKLLIGLAKGKKDHDKRASIKEKDWSRDKQRILRHR
ncbi:MAG: SsrA-binding protein SmpB [Gammaproteobacteria bacterium]|nr:SsrA-binding protein SmpB [Gammaproteobacteria bacterium]